MKKHKVMEKKRSSQPILLDDERESSTKDLSSQLERDHKMPDTKTTADAEKAGKDKPTRKNKH